MGIEEENHFLGSESARDALLRRIAKLPVDGRTRVDIHFEETDKPIPRTNQQNKSLHKWLEMLAEALNDAGFDLGDGKVCTLPVAFTKDNLKEGVVKPMLNALWPEKTSTTQLSTKEIQELYQRLDQIIAERTSVHVPWPERFGA